MKKLTALLLAGLMLLSAAACTPTPETPDTTDTQGDTTVETPTEAPTETPTEPTTEAPTEEETEAPKPERTVTNMYGDGYMEVLQQMLPVLKELD